MTTIRAWANCPHCHRLFEYPGGPRVTCTFCGWAWTATTPAPAPRLWREDLTAWKDKRLQ